MKNIFKVSLLALTSLMAVSCGGGSVNHKDCLNDYVKTLNYKDGFVIAQFTDVHWSTGTDAVDSKSYMNNLVDTIKEHYGHIDLIEFTGDQFMLSNTASVIDFLDWTESLGIPYATTWGNHDIEGTYNANWLSEQFMNAKNSLYTEVDYDDVHGRSNYIVNLVKDNKTLWQLAHLDSGASLTASALAPGRTYDYIREDQAKWWKDEHDLVGKDVPTIAYFHIAQKETTDAFEAVSKDSSAYYNKFYKTESFASSSLEAAKESSPFFEIAKDNGLKAEFMGHCHANDWTVDYEGVTIGLGVKSNIELYYGQINEEDSKKTDVNEAFDLIGASCVTLHDEGKFDLEHVYYNERSNGNLTKWVSYK